MVCTVAAVVFLLALNLYRVIITNKYYNKDACQQYYPHKIVRPTNLMSSSMTKYSHNMRLVNPLCAVNQRFWLLTQAAMTAWVYSCSLVYISRSGTHGFSSATRLSNVATSRQLCTHEQIQDHHSTSLLKQKYQKPLIQSIPFHDISSNIWYFHVLYRVSTSWPYCHFELTVGSYVSVRSWPIYGKFRQRQRSCSRRRREQV